MAVRKAPADTGAPSAMPMGMTHMLAMECSRPTVTKAVTGIHIPISLPCVHTAPEAAVAGKLRRAEWSMR